MAAKKLSVAVTIHDNKIRKKEFIRVIKTISCEPHDEIEIDCMESLSEHPPVNGRDVIWIIFQMGESGYVNIDDFKTVMRFIMVESWTNATWVSWHFRIALKQANDKCYWRKMCKKITKCGNDTVKRRRVKNLINNHLGHENIGNYVHDSARMILCMLSLHDYLKEEFWGMFLKLNKLWTKC
jgi:hypothetical protein